MLFLVCEMSSMTSIYQTGAVAAHQLFSAVYGLAPNLASRSHCQIGDYSLWDAAWLDHTLSGRSQDFNPIHVKYYRPVPAASTPEKPDDGIVTLNATGQHN